MTHVIIDQAGPTFISGPQARRIGSATSKLAIPHTTPILSPKGILPVSRQMLMMGNCGMVSARCSLVGA